MLYDDGDNDNDADRTMGTVDLLFDGGMPHRSY